MRPAAAVHAPRPRLACRGIQRIQRIQPIQRIQLHTLYSIQHYTASLSVPVASAENRYEIPQLAAASHGAMELTDELTGVAHGSGVHLVMRHVASALCLPSAARHALGGAAPSCCQRGEVVRRSRWHESTPKIVSSISGTP